MEESRQRATYPEIIDEKRLKTKKRIFLETFITLGFWGAFLYLLATFITFMLWLFGFQLVYYEIYGVGYQEMRRLFEHGGLVTLIVIAALFSWSYYNIVLIKIKGERRKSQVRICFDKDMAEFFHIDLDELERIKNNPRISVLIEQDTIIFSETDPSSSEDK